MKKFLSTLLYTAAATLLFSACGMTAHTVSSPVEPTVKSNEKTAVNNTALVYFSKDISPVSLIKLYDKINQDIHGKVAIKIHTGEKNGPNILPREIVMALQQHVPDSNLVETNTFYKGDRYTTASHRETLKVNGWDFCTVDIMDEEGAVMLPVKGGKHFQEMSIAKNMLNYDSMIVLTHFKGHTMGGFGGSMKNIAIGNADGRIGKAMLHTSDPSNPWEYSQERFMENMAESAKATTDFLVNKSFISMYCAICLLTATVPGLLRHRQQLLISASLLLQIFLPSIRLLSTLFLLYQMLLSMISRNGSNHVAVCGSSVT